MSAIETLPDHVLNDEAFRNFLYDEIRAAYYERKIKVGSGKESDLSTDFLNRNKKPVIVNYVYARLHDKNVFQTHQYATLGQKLVKNPDTSLGNATSIPATVIQQLVNFLQIAGYGCEGFAQRCGEQVACANNRFLAQKKVQELNAFISETPVDHDASFELIRAAVEPGTKQASHAKPTGWGAISGTVWLMLSAVVVVLAIAVFYGFLILREDIDSIEVKIDQSDNRIPAISSLDITFEQHGGRRDKKWVNIIGRITELTPVGDTVHLQGLAKNADQTARLLFDRSLKIHRDKGGAYFETTLPDIPQNTLFCLRFQQMTVGDLLPTVEKKLILQQVRTKRYGQNAFTFDYLNFSGIQKDQPALSCASLWKTSVSRDLSAENDKLNRMRQLEQTQSYARTVGIELHPFKEDVIRFYVNHYGRLSDPNRKRLKRFDLHVFRRDVTGDWAEFDSFIGQRISGATVELSTIAAIPQEILTCTLTRIHAKTYLAQTAYVRRHGNTGDYSLSPMVDETRLITEDAEFCRTLGTAPAGPDPLPTESLLLPKNTKVDFSEAVPLSLMGASLGDPWDIARFKDLFSMQGADGFEGSDEVALQLERHGIDKLIGFIDLRNHRSVVVARRKGQETVAAIWYRYRPSETAIDQGKMTAEQFKSQLDQSFGTEDIYNPQGTFAAVNRRYYRRGEQLGEEERLCFNNSKTFGSNSWSAGETGLSESTVNRYLGSIRFDYPDHRMTGAQWCGVSLKIQAQNLGRHPHVSYVLVDHGRLSEQANQTDP